LRLGPLLALALAQIETITGLAVPVVDAEAFRRLVPPGPLTQAVFARVVRPMHPSCDDASTRIARRLWYLRAHALRMPPRQLAAHLARKTWMRARARFDRTSAKHPAAPA
jgi:hypothetical protein